MKQVLAVLMMSSVLGACGQAETISGPTSTLGFHLVYQDEDGEMVTDPRKATFLRDKAKFYADEMSTEGVFIEMPAVITEQCLNKVAAGPYPRGHTYVLHFFLKKPCKETFANFTANNIDRQMAIVINGIIVARLRLHSVIENGSWYMEIPHSSKSDLETLAESF